jgi:hypothetical protein
MNFKIQEFKVDESSINPAILFDVAVEYYPKHDFPIYFSGSLNTLKGKTLGMLTEIRYPHNNDIRMPMSGDVSNFSDRGNFTISFRVELTHKAIEFIEEERNKNPDKSITFNILLFYKKMFFKTEGYGQNPTKLLCQSSCEQTVQYEIKQSDWAIKFAPKLGIGHIIIVELPAPEKQKVPKEWKERYEKLMENISSMQIHIQKGEWETVMFHGRKFYENIKVGNPKNPDAFRNDFTLLMENDQHSKDGIENFFTAIHNFFDFTSKYIHDKAKNGTFNTRPIHSKEDAYFVYTMAVGIINIVGKKLCKVV